MILIIYKVQFDENNRVRGFLKTCPGKPG